LILIEIEIEIEIERGFVMYNEWERKKPLKHRHFVKTDSCSCHYLKGTFSKEFKSLNDSKQVIVVYYCNECGQPVNRFTKAK